MVWQTPALVNSRFIGVKKHYQSTRIHQGTPQGNPQRNPQGKPQGDHSGTVCETVLHLQHTVHVVEHCIQSTVFGSKTTSMCYCYLWDKQHIVFMVVCETHNFYFIVFVSQTSFIFMVSVDPNNLCLAAKQPSREPNLELACDSSRQISALLHCSCSQAVF